jgi:peptidoglycan/LPS O-acetylase OafA/YrhL
MHTTEPQIDKPDWLSRYFIKRLFRIAPLFYLMIAAWVAAGFFTASGLRNLSEIILNLTFVFGFVPFSGVVWGGWSVGVEMIFYAAFPVLLLLIRTHRAAFIFLIISIIVSSALRSALYLQDINAKPVPPYQWSYFSFASNMCFFSMGIYAYLLSQSYKEHARLLSVYAPIVATVIIGGLLSSDLGALLYNSARLDIVLWGIGLSALCAWQGHRPSLLIANDALEYLGERSYSIYLLHPVIIFFLKGYLLKVYNLCSPIAGSYSFFVCAAILFIVILVVVEFTYRLIEVPGINLGRRLIELRKRRATNNPLTLEVNEHREAA